MSASFLLLLAPFIVFAAEPRTKASASAEQIEFIKRLEQSRESLAEAQAKADKGEIKVEEQHKIVAEAKKTIVETVAKAPEEPAVLTSAGRAMSQAGDDQAALGYLDKAVARDPKNAWALMNRAQVHAKTGDFEKAALDAERILEFDPENKAARALKLLTVGRGPRRADVKMEPPGPMGRVQALVAQADPAVPHTPEEWAAAQAKAPTEAGALLRKSIAARQKGDLGAALSYAEGAVKADPRDPMALFQHGRLLSSLGKNDEAVIALTKAILRGWKDAILFKTRAEALLKAKNPKAAREDAEMAVLLDPKLASGYALRALAGVQERRLDDEILADFKKAAELEPAQFSAQYEKAKADLAELKELQGEGLLGTVRPGQAKPPAPARDWSSLIKAGAALFIALFVLVYMILTVAPKPQAAASRLATATPQPVAPEPAQPVYAPSLLGRHIRIERLVGQGGMGQVYEGWDLNLKRRVAVKKLRPEFTSDPKEKERFEREAHTTGLLRHPGIPVAHELIEEADGLYIVGEFVEGVTVDERVASQGRLSAAECLPIVSAVCAALDYAHAEGVIHRDLKPANIMLAKDGTVKVMDFGIARLTRSPDGRTRTSLVYGTPPYMAPEQMDGDVSREADLFALGVCLYEMLTGRLPFDGPNMQGDKREGRFPPPSTFLAGGASLDPFFRKALDPKRDARYRSGAELAAAFAAAAA